MRTAFQHRLGAVVSACLLAAAAPPSHASCGAASCSLMTDRFAQGTGQPHAGWSTDVRLEAVTQDRLRSGTTRLSDNQVSGVDAIERRTRNLNLVAQFGFGLADGWSVALRVPFVRRDHVHDPLDTQTGLPGAPERWRFTRLGDARVLVRRAFDDADGNTRVAAFGGLKLPTGSTGVVNGDGSPAERSLQPGSGTTDLLFGVAVRRAAGPTDAWFAQAGLQHALGGGAAYRPGTALELSGGWSHAWTSQLGAVIQANIRRRAHDRGSEAEPADSGSTTLDVSPGLTVAAGPSATLYAYVQLPVYQRVRGTQLVPRRALALGWTQDF